MRYMLIMRSTLAAEQFVAENVDFDTIIAAMGRYNEELMTAGVLLSGEGLAGPEQGFVVDFSSDPPAVTEGASPGMTEQFNGYWMLAVDSPDEARAWAVKCPLGPGSTLEVRRVAETEEFDQDNEWIQKETGWRAEQAANDQS